MQRELGRAHGVYRINSEYIIWNVLKHSGLHNQKLLSTYRMHIFSIMHIFFPLVLNLTVFLKRIVGPVQERRLQHEVAC